MCKIIKFETKMYRPMRYYLPTWGQSLLLVLIFFAGSLGAAVPMMLGVKSISVLYVIPMAFPLAWAFFASRRNEAAGLEYVPIHEPRTGSARSMVPVFLAVIVATPFLGALLEPVTSMFSMSEKLQQMFERLFDTSRPVDLFISVSILAPLCEELLCRGIICRGLLAHNKPWFAIVFSAVLFAVLHGNLQQGFAALGLGIFMGWVYYKTHSLWCTVAIHFTNNTLSQVLLYLFPDMPMDATYASVIPQPWYSIFLVVGAIIVAASLLIIYNLYKDDQSIVSFALRPAASREEVGRECATEEVQ